MICSTLQKKNFISWAARLLQEKCSFVQKVSSCELRKTSSNLWGQSGKRVLVAIGTFINTLMRMVAMSKNKYIHLSKQLKLNNISMITRSGFCHARVMECFSTTGARAPAAATSSPSTSSTATSSSHTTSVAEWPGSPPWGQSSHSARAQRGL